MTYTTVDSIVRRTLLEKNLPVHWYAEFLYHCTAGLRELTLDTLKIINVVNLPINSYFAADLPSDFVDDIGVSIPVNGLLRPIHKSDSINPIRQHDSTGKFVPLENNPLGVTNGNTGAYLGWNWYWNYNEYGEPTGRFYGANAGDHREGYKVIKERRQIQFTESISTDNVVLMYISDGQSIDNASQVDVLALSTIQSYINWKRSKNADIERSPEGMAYLNMKRKLKSRMNSLTTTDIINIIRSEYSAAIKN